MDLSLNNKRILITGASRGIGLAIAESFMQEGAQACLVSRGSKDLYESEEKLKTSYGTDKTFTCKCDCTDSNSLKNLREKINSKWDGLDIVVVNVGDGNSVMDALPNDEDWKQTWNKNFESALHTARTFLPMLKNSKGSLIFISSITGIEAFGAPTDYSTAKSAIISLAKNMARKLACENVRVNVIAPGNIYFKGGSWDKKIKNNKKEVDNLIKSTVPMQRFGTPKEIADSVVFMCSDRASFITGTTLVIDGGQTVSI